MSVANGRDEPSMDPPSVGPPLWGPSIGTPFMGPLHQGFALLQPVMTDMVFGVIFGR